MAILNVSAVNSQNTRLLRPSSFYARLLKHNNPLEVDWYVNDYCGLNGHHPVPRFSMLFCPGLDLTKNHEIPDIANDNLCRTQTRL